jgi:hypothetical protein
VKKKPKFNQEMAIRGANRRLFARSPLVFEKLNESRQEFPRFKNDGSRAKKNWVKRQCEVCDEWVSSAHIAIDHIDPVVPPGGFPSHYDMWDRINLFLKRLWCDKSKRITRLIKQYTEELDTLEGIATLSKKDIISHQVDLKFLLKTVKKYTAKKKTPGLESIVERAVDLKELIQKRIQNG